MKKIISFALFTCMLLSVILPLSVYAAPAVDTSDPNTSRFYNDNSNTGFDAYPGTATIDGIWGEDDDWANALPLTLKACMLLTPMRRQIFQPLGTITTPSQIPILYISIMQNLTV